LELERQIREISQNPCVATDVEVCAVKQDSLFVVLLLTTLPLRARVAC
jgi:hypothetical protein